MDWGAGKGKGKYVPPTKEQSDEIKDTLKKNLPKAKGPSTEPNDNKRKYA